MKVNIVTEREDQSWILRKIALKLQEYNGWQIKNIIDETADINYFINYALYTPVRTMKAAWFTHPENKAFYDIAKMTDIRVCQAPQYAKQIDGHTIVPGVDEIFKPKLVIGICGRWYPSGRKGDDIVKAVRGLDFTEVKFTHPSWGTGEKVEFEDLPEFYRSIDYLLVPSTLEGGPIPVGEALACGTPVIAPKSVGNMELFNVVDYKAGNAENLAKKLWSLYTEKLKIANTAPYSWEVFAQKHYELFRQNLETKSTGDKKVS